MNRSVRDHRGANGKGLPLKGAVALEAAPEAELHAIRSVNVLRKQLDELAEEARRALEAPEGPGRDRVRELLGRVAAARVEVAALHARALAAAAPAVEASLGPALAEARRLVDGLSPAGG